MRRFLLAAAVVTLASPATAAPFCLQMTGVPPQCIYEDVTLCRRDAQRQNAVCGLNARLVLPSSNQRFCLAQNGPVIQCLYPDRRSCDAAAARARGICIDAGGEFARPDPDRIPR